MSTGKFPVSTEKFPVSTLVGVFVGTLQCVLHRQSLNLRGHFRGHLRVHSRVHFREHFRESSWVEFRGSRALYLSEDNTAGSALLLLRSLGTTPVSGKTPWE